MYQSLDYLATLSRDEYGITFRTKIKTLKIILKMIDMFGVEKTYQKLKVPPFMIDSINFKRIELMSYFRI